MRATARQVRATHTLVQLADSVADPVPMARPEARLCSSMSCSFLVQHVRHATKASEQMWLRCKRSLQVL